jgi:hypothetical protein
VSTKFVQTKALGSKLALPHGLVIVFPYMYIAKIKKIFYLKKQTNSLSLDIWHEISSHG